MTHARERAFPFAKMFSIINCSHAWLYSTTQPALLKKIFNFYAIMT